MTLRIVNLIHEHGEERSLERITRHVYHRLSFAQDDGGGYFDDVNPVPDREVTGYVVRERFSDTRKGERDWQDRPGRYTGGNTPYFAVVLTSGEIHQLLEAAVISPHARAWSIPALGTAFIGDFREHRLTQPQRETAIEWGALWHAWGLSTWGHDELPGGSSGQKACPGSLFELDRVRQEIARHPYSALTSWGAERMLVDLGVVF